MKALQVVIGLLILLALLPPVQGFTAEKLTIEIQAEGGATVQFTYSLSWMEQFAVFLRIANPPNELAAALQGYAGVPVTVTSLDSSSTTFSLERFARVENEGNIRTLVTPPIQFTEAEKALQRYWFAPLISVDFSPAVATIQFPDGYQEVRLNEEQLPSFTHSMVLPLTVWDCGCNGIPTI